MASSPSPPYQSPLALQPLAVSELFDHAIRMYRRNFALFAGLGLASGVPDLARKLVSGGARSQDQLISAFTGGGGPVGTALSVNPLLVLAGYLVWLVCLPVTSAIVFQAAVDVAAGTNPTFGQVLARTLRRYWGFALVLLIYVIGFLPSITCILIPLSIWLAVRWVAAFPAMFAEGAGAIKAVERSTFLTANRWWRTFGILLLTYLLVLVVSLALQAVLGLGVGIIPGLTGDLRGAAFLVATSIGGGFVLPIPPIIVTLLYFDLRVRREALELDVLARQAMLAPPPPLA